MARLVLSALSVLSLVALVAACAAPKNGCNTTAICSKLGSVSSANMYTWKNNLNLGTAGGWASLISNVGAGAGPSGFGLIADVIGSQNKLVTQTVARDARGMPPVNWEKFTTVGAPKLTIMNGGSPYTGESLKGCCTKCANTADCNMYHYFDYTYSTSESKYALTDYDSTKIIAGMCFLLKDTDGSGNKAIAPGVADEEQYRPASGSHTDQGTRPTKTTSFVGGYCNGYAKANDDPHFTGAHGTRYEFNGELDRSFCLTTDKNLQINALLKGYSNAKVGMRSWMREVALLWTDKAGKAHKLHLVARTGKQQERGQGFLAKVTLDGKTLALPQEPGVTAQGGDMTLSFLGVGKNGPLDVDRYNVQIDGLLDLSVSLRVAHHLLQTPGDAEVHFNLVMNSIETTDKVHGVLGQTYRESAQQQKKALKYRELTQLLGHPVHVDKEEGMGFLEGSVRDYETSTVLSADCKFSAFAA